MKNERGFTIVELMVAIAVTLILMAAAVSVYQKAVQVATITNEQSDMQTELRGAMNQLTRDLNQAGTGIPVGGIPIPSSSTGGSNPMFACDASICYISSGNSFTQGVLYKVTPANGVGANILQASDAIIITYLDSLLSPLANPAACSPACNWSSSTTTTLASNGSTVTMPTGLSPAMNDAANGLNVGDVMMLQNSVGSAVGVITAYDASSRIITFASGDPLAINQPTASAGNIKALKSGATYPAVTVSRVMMITYFIRPIVSAGVVVDSQLMRQIGGRTPTVVADHIEDLQFTYDVFDTNTSTLTAALPDAATGSPAVAVPNQIRKINVSMTVRSPRPNAQGKYDHFTLSTSIGPRNLSFQDRYN